jgi:hypothetical protein
MDDTANWAVEWKLETLDDRLQEQVGGDFSPHARKIVEDVKEVICVELSDKLPAKRLQELRRLDKVEVDKVVEKINSAFNEKEMGRKSLISMAKREIAAVLIRKSVKRYSVKPPTGMFSPVEYFERFYRNIFVLFGIPANSVSVIDPNLHLCLKRRGEFKVISNILKQGYVSATTKAEPI